VTFSVRLTRAEQARLLALAEAQRVDPSSLVRSWIHQGHGPSGDGGHGASPDRSTVPRWALLPREERAIAQVIAERTTASAFGLVLLEDVIDAVVEDGMDRPAAMHWMAELAQRGWIDQAGAECETGERLEGKSAFLFTYGRLSAYAFERISSGDRSGQG
jgi:hypothetical protein